MLSTPEAAARRTLEFLAPSRGVIPTPAMIAAPGSPPGRSWTVERMRATLQKSDVLVERALVVLYYAQTTDEQIAGQTSESNGVGFNGVDAEILTSFAQQVLKNGRGYDEGRRLSPKQRDLARRKLAKYSAQLVRCIG